MSITNTYKFYMNFFFYNDTFIVVICIYGVLIYMYFIFYDNTSFLLIFLQF